MFMINKNTYEAHPASKPHERTFWHLLACSLTIRTCCTKEDPAVPGGIGLTNWSSAQLLTRWRPHGCGIASSRSRC